MYQTVRAIANGTPLPALAQQVAQALHVPVQQPSAARSQVQQAGASAPRVTLAQAQQVTSVTPGSPAFFAPLLRDVQAALHHCQLIRQKGVDPALHAQCLLAVHEAPSMIDVANGAQAYGGREKAALLAVAEHPAAGSLGTLAINFRQKATQPALSIQEHALKFAIVICEAAGIQRCSMCGEFMASPHACPPTSFAARLSSAAALNALKDAPSLVELANAVHTFRKGGSPDNEKYALRIAAPHIGTWEKAQIPGVSPALLTAKHQWDDSESGAHATAFAQALCVVVGLPRCPTCQGYLGDYHLCAPPAPPKRTGLAKRQAVLAASVVEHAPSLIDLANGGHAYGSGPDPQAEGLHGPGEGHADLRTVKDGSCPLPGGTEPVPGQSSGQRVGIRAGTVYARRRAKLSALWAISQHMAYLPHDNTGSARDRNRATAPGDLYSQRLGAHGLPVLES